MNIHAIQYYSYTSIKDKINTYLKWIHNSQSDLWVPVSYNMHVQVVSFSDSYWPGNEVSACAVLGEGTRTRPFVRVRPMRVRMAHTVIEGPAVQHTPIRLWSCRLKRVSLVKQGARSSCLLFLGAWLASARQFFSYQSVYKLSPTSLSAFDRTNVMATCTTLRRLRGIHGNSIKERRTARYVVRSMLSWLLINARTTFLHAC